MVIPQGETQYALGHSWTFWGYDDSRANGKHSLRIEVDRESKPWIAEPQVFYNARMGAWTRTPAIRRYLWQDLYISPSEYLPASDPNTAALTPEQETQVGRYRLRFDGFRVEDHLANEQAAEVGATVTITEGDTVRQVTPAMRLEVGKPAVSLPIDLGGGKKLVLDNFVPGTREVLLRVEGLNLPVEPARAVVDVSTKPAIALVWVGTILMALGTGLATVRRRLELRPAPASVPRTVPVPGRRLGGLLPRISYR